MLKPGEMVDRDAVLRKLVDIQYSRNDTGARPRHLPRPRRDARGLPRLRRDRLPRRVLRRRGRGAPGVRPADRRGPQGARARRRSGRPPTTPPTATRSSARSARSATSSRRAPRSSRPRASRSSRTGCASAPSSTWRCCASSASATGSRTTRASSTAARPASGPTACSTSSPTTSSASSTSRTRPCRRSAACTRATARASRRWSTTASGCPSALDNRPQTFDEFLQITPQIVFVSATPGDFERDHSVADRRADRAARPGIVDPEVEVRETKNQIDDLMNEIRARTEAGERTLVTTLTKKMSEDLTDYLHGVRLPGPLPALRDRHARADPDHPRAAPRRVRRAGGREPAARGARPARGVAGGDPRRRQGGLPARRDLADPDDRPRRPQHPRAR